MQIITRYRCNLCMVEYDSEKEALECENTILEVPDYLLPPNISDGQIPAFGPNGISWVTVIGLNIHGNHYERYPNTLSLESLGRYLEKTHVWMVSTDPDVSIEMGCLSSDLPSFAFDPRIGYDAFRYDCTKSEFEIWKQTMKIYGFKIEDITFALSNRLSRWLEATGKKEEE